MVGTGVTRDAGSAFWEGGQRPWEAVGPRRPLHHSSPLSPGPEHKATVKGEERGASPGGPDDVEPSTHDSEIKPAPKRPGGEAFNGVLGLERVEPRPAIVTAQGADCHSYAASCLEGEARGLSRRRRPGGSMGTWTLNRGVSALVPARGRGGRGHTRLQAGLPCGGEGGVGMITFWNVCI